MVLMTSLLTYSTAGLAQPTVMTHQICSHTMRFQNLNEDLATTQFKRHHFKEHCIIATASGCISMCLKRQKWSCILQTPSNPVACRPTRNLKAHTLTILSSGQSKGECGGTAFPHVLFSASVVPPPGFKCQALITWKGGERKECVHPPLQSYFDDWSSLELSDHLNTKQRFQYRFMLETIQLQCALSCLFLVYRDQIFHTQHSVSTYVQRYIGQ